MLAEKSYSPFLLEKQASVWGMNHFSAYLQGQHFTPFTDHWPLERVSRVHTKMLNQLQKAILQFNFKMLGSEMPADFLSRNVVNTISFKNKDLGQGQAKDEKLKALYNFLMTSHILDTMLELYRFIKMYQVDSFIKDGLL